MNVCLILISCKLANWAEKVGFSGQKVWRWKLYFGFLKNLSQVAQRGGKVR